MRAVAVLDNDLLRPDLLGQGANCPRRFALQSRQLDQQDIGGNAPQGFARASDIRASRDHLQRGQVIVLHAHGERVANDSHAYRESCALGSGIGCAARSAGSACRRVEHGLQPLQVECGDRADGVPQVDQLLDDCEARDFIGRILALPGRTLAWSDNVVAPLPDAQRLHGDTCESCCRTAAVNRLLDQTPWILWHRRLLMNCICIYIIRKIHLRRCI